MDSGGGNTTVTNSIPDWVQPYATGFLQQAGQVNSQPYQAYQGQGVAGLSPGSQSAIQGINNLAGGGPGLYAAEQNLGETLSGQGMNPYQSGVVNRVVNDATQAYTGATNANLARFSGANRNGSSYGQAQGALDQNFAKGLGDAIAPIYQTGYENERGRQMQAAGMMPSIYSSLGQGYQNALGANEMVNQNNQQQLTYGLNQFNQQQQYPTNQLNTYGNAIASMLGGAGRNTTTNAPGSDTTMQGAGAIMSLLPYLYMFASDRRLKSNIQRVGTHPLGIGIYDYDIGGERQRGVMADEVARVRPEAVARHPDGYLMVNYAGLETH